MDLHLTIKGRQVKPETSAESATGQFEISDERSATEIARLLQSKGFDPVWKDWDSAILEQAINR
jgi:2-iminoacetate synthase ThiH